MGGGVNMELIKRVLNVQKPDDVKGAIIEAWAQGFMVAFAWIRT